MLALTKKSRGGILALLQIRVGNEQTQQSTGTACPTRDHQHLSGNANG